MEACNSDLIAAKSDAEMEMDYQTASNSYINKLRLVHPAGLANNSTAFMIWNAALVTKAFLNKERLHKKFPEALKVLDVSSGNGYLSCCAACMGAEVIATEFNLAYPLLEKNCEFNASVYTGRGNMRTVEYKWGDPAEVIGSLLQGSRIEDLDIVIFSDLLFIAIRDDIEDLFLNTILSVVPIESKAEIVFCFERRKYEHEDSFIARLALYFQIEERDVVKDGFISACREDPISGETEDFELSLFYRNPAVRLLLLKRRRQ